MINTGRVVYGTLKQVFVDTGEPTGELNKDNLPEDPDYISPVEDPETCVPAVVPPPLVNKVRVQIVNQATQVVVLSNVMVRGATVVDLTKAYYTNASLSLMPGASITSTPTDQLDDLSRFIATAFALSKGIRINVAIQYKTAVDGSFTDLVDQNLQLSNTIDVATLNTPRISGSGINDIKIIITENPIPVDPTNPPPVVSAGIDLSIKLPTSSLTLTGTAVDSGGSIASTLWSQVSGPSTAIIATPTSLSTLMSGLVEGLYVFRFSATDNLGATSSDTVQVTVEPADPNPNGIINIFVDSNMPDTTNAVSQITLTDRATLATTNLLSASVNKTSGVVQKTPVKGNYNIQISVVVSSGPRSIKVNWGASEIIILAAATGTYTIDNVYVDEGLNGVLIDYRAAALTPSFSLVYAKLTLASSVTNSEPLLPFGLKEAGSGDVLVSFYSDAGGTIPVSFTGTVNCNVQILNQITSSTTNSLLTKSVSGSNSVIVETARSYKRWDYTLNNPSMVEVDDLVEDLVFNYSLLPGQGYLIIP